MTIYSLYIFDRYEILLFIREGFVTCVLCTGTVLVYTTMIGTEPSNQDLLSKVAFHLRCRALSLHGLVEPRQPSRQHSAALETRFHPLLGLL